MLERFIVVVGDKFKEFAAGKDVLTMAQLRGLMAVPHLVSHPGRLVLVPGQGLSEDDVSEVLSIVHDASHTIHFDLSVWETHPPRAASAHSHKRHRRNTIISEPRRIDEDSFVLDLLIDEKCELMSDHQTGQHVQGMILMEAARQSFLAVTEAFFLPQSDIKHYFVIDEMTMRYKRFMFPVGAQLRYQVREKELGNRKRFLVDIAVEQNGLEAAGSTIGFTVFEASRIARRETDLARETLAAHVGLLSARAEAPSAVAEAA